MARIFHTRPRAVNPMLVLILGLLIFLGVHSVRIFADGWRASTIARIGEKPWKGLYTLVSLIGFGLIVWGYSLARQQPVVLWQPPVMMKHLNSLFTLAAFILLAAAYVPRNQIKARLHHPMVLAVKLWAFGHLLATAKLADVVLFGAFLLWAILDFRAARQRDRALGTVYALSAGAEDAAQALTPLIADSWGLPTAFSLLAWFVFAPQCLSTIAVIRRETNSWRWPLFALGYLFVLAYVAAGITFWTATALGLG